MNWITILFAAGPFAMVRRSQSKIPQKKIRAKQQVVREGSFELDISAGRALPLFTPEGERVWAKGWDPKPIFPPEQSVAFKANSVFRLDHGRERSLWTILEADPQKYIAEYVCVVEGVRLSRVRVRIQPRGEERCRVHVRYVHTATSEKGLRFVASVTEQAYAQKMLDWQRMVNASIQ